MKSSSKSQTIVILPHACARPLAELTLSTRLRNILWVMGCRTLGDLHGRTYKQIERQKNCGPKTLTELWQLLQGLNDEALPEEPPEPPALETGGLPPLPQEPPLAKDALAKMLRRAVYVPPQARDWALAQLPLSRRLAGLAGRLGCQLLGGFHGRSWLELRKQQNCGWHTITELQTLLRRVQAGEFDRLMTDESEKDLAWLIRWLNDWLENLPPREQELLHGRLGAHAQKPCTLGEVGGRLGLTRERIRQIADKIFQRMQRAGGPVLALALGNLAEQCQATVCPLTPELFVHWLGTEPALDRFSPPFYLRLLGELAADIPVWPEVQRSKYPTDLQPLIRRLRELLRQHAGPLLLREAFEQLRADERFAHLKPGDFLDALRRDGSLEVDWRTPDQPYVLPPQRHKLRARDYVRLVLAEAERPLTPAEIVAQARQMFGDELRPARQHTWENLLMRTEGFYLLGPRAWGLRQHFRLPQALWSQVRDDFYHLLAAVKRPFSTREVINERRFAWAEQTNAYELAELLREDERLIDQGRLHFALAVWGDEEREHISDLLPKILAEAGRPLTTGEIIERLRQHRSCSSVDFAACLRRCPEVRRYGYGFYGLTFWERRAPAMLVAEPRFVNCVILAAKPPFTFGDLCRRLGVAPQGKLAKQLWQTVQALPRVSRQPKQQKPETHLIHRRWSEKPR